MLPQRDVSLRRGTNGGRATKSKTWGVGWGVSSEVSPRPHVREIGARRGRRLKGRAAAVFCADSRSWVGRPPDGGGPGAGKRRTHRAARGGHSVCLLLPEGRRRRPGSGPGAAGRAVRGPSGQRSALTALEPGGGEKGEGARPGSGTNNGRRETPAPALASHDAER